MMCGKKFEDMKIHYGEELEDSTMRLHSVLTKGGSINSIRRETRQIKIIKEKLKGIK